jgi:surfeit locus 1 family protein
MLAVLAALGTWQLQRLAWKNQVIGEVHAALAAEAVELPLGVIDARALAYRRVSINGHFDHGNEFHLLSPGPHGEHGYRVVTPLLRDSGAGRDGGHEAVLVDRGWVPAANKSAATRRPSQIAGVVTVSGVVRQSSRGGWFVPDNDVAANLWFSADAGTMQRSLGLGGPELFVATDALLLTAGSRARIEIANPHLQYAVIWYGLAAALAAIYVLWHRSLQPRRSQT